MAFFTSSDDTLARTLWPEGIGCPIREVMSQKNIPVWKKLPPTYDELCERLVIDRASSTDVKIMMPHFDDEGVETEIDLRLRLTGFVASVNLAVTGNWKGTPDHAPKAMQYLTLSAGAFPDAFNPQRAGVMAIEEMILGTFSQGMGSVGRNNQLYLSRRTFMKATTPGVSPIQLAPREDPKGKLRGIRSHWVVDHRVQVGVQNDDGKVYTREPMVIRRGDFVDVLAGVEVVKIRGRQGPTTNVMFVPLQVVRLKSAQQASAIVQAITNAGPMPGTSHQASAADESFVGFSFEEGENGGEDVMTV